jgi:hypothetical protein
LFWDTNRHYASSRLDMGVDTKRPTFPKVEQPKDFAVQKSSCLEEYIENYTVEKVFAGST